MHIPEIKRATDEQVLTPNQAGVASNIPKEQTKTVIRPEILKPAALAEHHLREYVRNIQPEAIIKAESNQASTFTDFYETAPEVIAKKLDVSSVTQSEYIAIEPEYEVNYLKPIDSTPISSPLPYIAVTPAEIVPKFIPPTNIELGSTDNPEAVTDEPNIEYVEDTVHIIEDNVLAPETEETGVLLQSELHDTTTELPLSLFAIDSEEVLPDTAVTETDTEQVTDTEYSPFAEFLDQTSDAPEVATSTDVQENIAIEYEAFAALFNPEPTAIQDPQAPTDSELMYTELQALPPICIEVVNVIAELPPESVEIAKDILLDINHAVDVVINLRINGDELAPEAEKQLEDLCVKLFTYLGIEDYDEQTVMEFVQGIILARKDGTREAKQDDDQIPSQFAQIMAFPWAKQLGTMILQLVA